MMAAMSGKTETLHNVYLRAVQTLEDYGIHNSRQEALYLCERFFGIKGRTGLAVKGDIILKSSALDEFNKALIERKNRPLQYILSSWEFFGMELSVGEGVLIPREDTSVLTMEVLARLSQNTPTKILDLCAGTGAVGLSLLQNLPNSHCVFVEFSDEALPYLKKNCARYGDGRFDIIQADVLKKPELNKRFEVIVSNPPYIKSGDIKSLELTVQAEPVMALDGGEDGLCFYRAICSLWREKLNPGGILAFEIGFDQADLVSDIMASSGFENIDTIKDQNGKNRVIIGTYRK